MPNDSLSAAQQLPITSAHLQVSPTKWGATGTGVRLPPCLRLQLPDTQDQVAAAMAGGGAHTVSRTPGVGPSSLTGQ
jgi:hypothetical protein